MDGWNCPSGMGAACTNNNTNLLATDLIIQNVARLAAFELGQNNKYGDYLSLLQVQYATKQQVAGTIYGLSMLMKGSQRLEFWRCDVTLVQSLLIINPSNTTISLSTPELRKENCVPWFMKSTSKM